MCPTEKIVKSNNEVMNLVGLTLKTSIYFECLMIYSAVQFVSKNHLNTYTTWFSESGTHSASVLPTRGMGVD